VNLLKDSRAVIFKIKKKFLIYLNFYLYSTVNCEHYLKINKRLTKFILNIFIVK